MFNKDLLLVDIEATGVDVNKHEMIQLAAILLDKKTLKVKKSFNQYIKPRKWKNRDPEAMQVCGITWEQVKNAPTLPVVLRKFNQAFGHNVILTNYGGNMDFVFLAECYRQAKMRYAFDYHTLNIWALAFLYTNKTKTLKNKKKFTGFGLEDIAHKLKVALPENRHDALADCELEAGVLRQLVKKLKV